MSNREWNPKSFFRHLTPDALNHLQAWAQVDLDLDGEVPLRDRVYRAWKALAENDRQRIETSLLLVNDLCAPHARPYLTELSVVVWALAGHVQLIVESLDWSVQDLAVRLFVADEKRFAEAHQAYFLDLMAHCKEFHGRYPVSPASLNAHPEDGKKMQRAMAEHLLSHEYGSRCLVEKFANDEKFALFVFREDEITSVDRFNDKDVLEPQWLRPVIRLAAVFQFETSTLLVKAPRAAEREKLRDLFAQVCIGDADYFEDATKTSKFCFDPLRDAGFDFPTRGIDKIEEVSIVKVIAKSGHRGVRRVTIDMDPGLSNADVRTRLADHGVDLDADVIDGVHMRFRFEGKGPSKNRTVSLLNPNSSNLNDTERDRIIRRHLKDWAIDASGRREALGAAVLEAAA